MSQGPSTPPAALIALTDNGRALAQRIAGDSTTDGEWARVHAPAGIARGTDTVIGTGIAAHLRTLYLSQVPVVAICACGIVIRALAPVLGSKHDEPAVVAIAEDGSAVVPLLGGHRGANELAVRIASKLSTSAAITTASDRRFGVALDAPPPGYTLANPQHYKPFVAAMLAGERVRLDGHNAWLADADLPLGEAATLTLRTTDKAEPGSTGTLVYHPRSLALGVGCERGTPAEDVHALVTRTLAAGGLAPASIAGVFSLDLKADEPAIIALERALGVPVRFFDAATLEAQAPRLSRPSEIVFQAVGCHGVAEGAALAAAGEDAELLVEKTRGLRATCAIARARGTIDSSTVTGAAPAPALGSLSVVGLGPGDPAQRTPAATAAIVQAEDLVGYTLYLELAAPLGEGKRLHPYALGEERCRVRYALELARSGKRTALICSGDPGVYAMASLVFEEVEANANAFAQVDVRVVPGVSAMQSAAALAGAPLGHDFCAISLSDLLTPWPVIERRLRAACEGEFVIALYNPISRSRREPLEKALRILQASRPAATPVIIGRQLGRPGQSLDVVDLAALTPDHADMLTVLIIGSGETRALGHTRPRTVYTPRGYRAKPAHDDRTSHADSASNAAPGAPSVLSASKAGPSDKPRIKPA